ncbi:type IV toxin-antitoxin system AbiEi family antitoxin domain-containing protein [Lapillicoccus sp.]|uniref:type IV toxin-antitoxin system AbiEi family antitoxin domain-containing protein n=1 Tax=Lapillicoccus sp. TaxID=1909287 RepID=UPI0025F6296D|nr:type IV toxin-antitoxin system AbiEi family antitoxin domain-containing protein [Lapillicoccus sp.]
MTRPRMLDILGQMEHPELPPVFTRVDALTLGLSDYRLRGLVRSGTVRRVRNGLYELATPVAPRQRAAHALLSARAALSMRGPGYVVSHLTAAAALGLPLPLGPVDTIHLTDLERRVARTRRRRGLWIHHADSYDTDVDIVSELLVTTVSRTVADCLRMFRAEVSVPIADAALHLRLATPDDITAELAMQCHWKGRAMRADVAAPLVDGRRESWLESFAAVKFDDWEIDPPTPQLIILDARKTFVARADAGWEDEGTVLEIDGKTKYALPKDGVVDAASAWEAEKDRFDRVGDLGLERVRFGLHHLLHESELIRRRVRERRQVGSASRFTGSFRLLPDEGLRLT